MIQLLEGNTIIWSLNLDPEIEAGMALALYVILMFSSVNHTIKLGNINYVVKNGQIPQTFLPEYLAYFDVERDFSLPIVNRGTQKYLLSVFSGNKYNIYHFKSAKFIQGFIAGFDYFNEDFRKFIHKLPYTLDERGNKNSHLIQGYDVGAY